MKFQLALLALPLLAVANPLASSDAPALPSAVPEPEPLPEPEVRGGDVNAFKKATTCALTGSDVRYRKCPDTNDKKCPALGQYGKKGTKVAFQCYTTGKPVNGNP
ncbi:MAG: hypothetical protein Q9217_006749, partial [Psora testacea]